MKIIGQSRLINTIDGIESLDALPKSIIISGVKGSGRHTIFNYICDRFNLEFEDIEYELSLDKLNEMYNLSIPKMYLIDLDSLGEKKRLERFQNTLLKFIEEPPRFAWIVIIVYNYNVLLNTILNRCVCYNLSPYTLLELKEIAKVYDKNISEEDLRLLKTPFNIQFVELDTISEIKNLSINIIENMYRANISNALSIKNKFEYIDINLFISIFIDILYEYYLDSFDIKYYNALILTKELSNNLSVLNVNKTYLIENYLLTLKLILDD